MLAPYMEIRIVDDQGSPQYFINLFLYIVFALKYVTYLLL